MGLHWTDHYWYFSSALLSSSFWGLYYHEISWCLPLVWRRQTWRLWRACYRRSRLACPCMYAARTTFISGIYTLLKSARGHASGMYFLHRPAHQLDGLHCFSCAFQNGPDRGWMERQTLPPFYSFHNWHNQLLTVEYFWKALLLCRLPTIFPCAWTSNMSPCRTFLQNTIPVCRLVSPTSWGRRKGEYCWVLQGPFLWQRLIQGKVEGIDLVPLVL